MLSSLVESCDRSTPLVSSSSTRETTSLRLILKCSLSPGDIVVMTAAVRDLQLAYPGRFLVDVRTSAREIWENNSYLTPLDDDDPEVRTLELHCPLIHESNQRPYHFIHAFAQHLGHQLGLPIPQTRFNGDIHISALEKTWMSQVEETGFLGRFWIIVAGGKYDYTAKWWNPAHAQAVVDHFRGRILFVQCGESGHWHPRLDGALDLIGKTDLRQFIRLIYHSDGVLCPVNPPLHEHDQTGRRHSEDRDVLRRGEPPIQRLCRD